MVGLQVDAEQIGCRIVTSRSAEPVGVVVDNLSLSAGMTLLLAGDELDEALQRADQALYQAKQNGRNRLEARSVGS